MSFPSWERGLKQAKEQAKQDAEKVVPLVGTWIETGVLSAGNHREPGRSPRGNVD